MQVLELEAPLAYQVPRLLLYLSGHLCTLPELALRYKLLLLLQLIKLEKGVDVEDLRRAFLWVYLGPAELPNNLFWHVFLL